MTVQARTFGAAAPSPSAEPTLAEWISLLKGYFEQLVRTANTVIVNPHFTLETATHPVEAARARRVRRTRFGTAAAPAAVEQRRESQLPGVLLPMHVPEIRRRTTFDNPENSYFKYLLLETLRRLQQVAVVHDTGDEDADLSAEQRFFEALRPEAASMIRRIQGLLRAPFLQDLPSAVTNSVFSPVLYRHPAIFSLRANGSIAEQRPCHSRAARYRLV